jgi:hypothetical protein
MSRIIVAAGPRLVGRRVILRLLAASREVRSMVGGPTRARAAEARAMVDTGDAQPSARISFIAVDRDHATERVDAVAGGEFVDDKIRLTE